jgi:hypothetical protein
MLMLFSAVALHGQNYSCLRGAVTLGVNISGSAPGGYSSCNAVISSGVLVWQFYSVAAQAGRALSVSFTVTGTTIGVGAFYSDTTMTMEPLVYRIGDCTGGCTLAYTPPLSQTYYFQIGGIAQSPVAYTFTVTAPSQGQMPNLTPYQPPGWSDKIVVSTVPCSVPCDTNVDSRSLQATDPLYVSMGYVNNGTAPRPAVNVVARLYIDGADSGWYWGPGAELPANYYSRCTPANIGTLSAGVHTLTMKVDPDNEIAESNEADNEYSKTITVSGAGSSACTPSENTLCLNGSRFRVSVSWNTTDGRSGQGQAILMTGDTGYFWFFSAANVELVVKVLDGRTVNGHYWVFYGALSNVKYRISVTDTETGVIKEYANPQGTLASVADTAAF